MTLTTAAVFLGAWLVMLMAFEDKFIYFPTRAGRVTASGSDVWLRAQDGVKLHAFHRESPEAHYTLLYLHGNAGNLATRSEMIEYFARLPANVLALDYRGYGQSEGTPSEQGLYADTLAAYRWLSERVPADRIVVFGESLGGGPACELAVTQPIGGLVLHATFTRIADMAALAFPWLPVRHLVRTRFDNLEKVARSSAPKLFIHSRRDEVIPFSMGERLLQAAKPPKQALWLQRAGHNDSYFIEGPRLQEALRTFLEALPHP